MDRISELREQILLAPVTDMKPHVQRGAFILIDPSLDLAETAVLLADNKAEQVAVLIEKGFIRKGSMEDYALWRSQKTFFNFLIVQPFVVAKVFDPQKSN